MAYVNFLYDENSTRTRICINFATDRFLQRMFTKVIKITLCNDHYAVQGDIRLSILVPIESSYAIRYIRLTLLCLTP